MAFYQFSLWIGIKYRPKEKGADLQVAFGSAESVVEYLGRYTHRVAISNARILKVTKSHVTFSWCDRENGYQKKTETIPGTEFLKRFLDHIVPPYFRRIRHLGFLSTRSKKQSLEAIRESLGEKLVRFSCGKPNIT